MTKKWEKISAKVALAVVGGVASGVAGVWLVELLTHYWNIKLCISMSQNYYCYYTLLLL